MYGCDLLKKNMRFGEVLNIKKVVRTSTFALYGVFVEVSGLNFKVVKA